jgi:hypothetical protein
MTAKALHATISVKALALRSSMSRLIKGTLPSTFAPAAGEAGRAMELIAPAGYVRSRAMRSATFVHLISSRRSAFIVPGLKDGQAPAVVEDAPLEKVNGKALNGSEADFGSRIGATSFLKLCAAPRTGPRQPICRLWAQLQPGSHNATCAAAYSLT